MAKTILVVDDDPTSNMLVSFLLKSQNYDVSVALDGEEGLKKAVEEKPALVVLDIMMPKKDGYTFLRELKQEDYINMPKIIMLTHKDQMEQTFKMEGVGAYFVKPLNTEQFLSDVRRLIGTAEED